MTQRQLCQLEQLFDPDPRGHFPNEQAALKCVYLAVMSLDPDRHPAANAGRCAGNQP
ncbi:hypothetical protein EV644_12456 [Kribbella orskensis]|uniref:Transposase n=1 Tax=Kribbella orskensis TaxID=2512216 RepID=A0ABY2B9S1_9ACTN|nr:hypothetical protein EV642_12642 [Kribbella sp. VKM Ac-2500]TCO12932.1 hypothetical protein EV644_12456 [Kribbella orskensis]